jgi:hypothetical protein
MLKLIIGSSVVALLTLACAEKKEETPPAPTPTTPTPAPTTPPPTEATPPATGAAADIKPENADQVAAQLEKEINDELAAEEK